MERISLNSIIEHARNDRRSGLDNAKITGTNVRSSISNVPGLRKVSPSLFFQPKPPVPTLVPVNKEMQKVIVAREVIVAPAPEPVAPAPEPVAPATEPVAPAPEPAAPAPEPAAPAPEPAAPAPEPAAPAPRSTAGLSRAAIKKQLRLEAEANARLAKENPAPKAPAPKAPAPEAPAPEAPEPVMLEITESYAEPIPESEISSIIQPSASENTISQ